MDADKFVQDGLQKYFKHFRVPREKRLEIIDNWLAALQKIRERQVMENEVHRKDIETEKGTVTGGA